MHYIDMFLWWYHQGGKGPYYLWLATGAAVFSVIAYGGYIGIP